MHSAEKSSNHSFNYNQTLRKFSAIFPTAIFKLMAEENSARKRKSFPVKGQLENLLQLNEMYRKLRGLCFQVFGLFGGLSFQVA